tara:strand:+ start:4055 stop:5320 length:1266 start_codon:yes stop_codon:yes gene_type:complete
MRILRALLLALMLLFSLAMPVSAIADPDTPPSINAVYVYNDLLEDGDAGILIDYFLDYAVPPTETATEAYMGIFIDTDGSTQLRSVAPYAYQNDGYDRGLIWIYFTAAEVTANSIDVASIALYEVWLVGNPTLSWPGDPPKTTAGIDYWQPVGTDTGVLLALRVLFYADLLEIGWAVDLIQTTSLGSRLTTLGADYFENVIPNLRTIAPSAFASGQSEPTLEDIDYSTDFGATMTDGTGTVTGSPITLVAGANTVTVTGVGTFTLILERGTVGTVANGTGTVTGSPVALVYGTNTITVPGGGAGTLIVTVNLDDTTSDLDTAVTGTGFDLTTVATRFGMSRWMFSGLVWLAISIIICSCVYGMNERRQGFLGSGKVVMIVFDICIIGGTVLGLMHPLVAVLLFIGFGALSGYVLFFKGAHV